MFLIMKYVFLWIYSVIAGNAGCGWMFAVMIVFTKGIAICIMYIPYCVAMHTSDM